MSKRKKLSTEADDRKDFELAKASGAGDMVAFEKIYQRHHRQVFCLCLRMLKSNESLAEDLTQEVFVELFRPRQDNLPKIASFKGDSKFSTWLHRFTVNQVLMYFRKRTSKEFVADEESEFEQVVDKNRTTQPEAIVDRVTLERAINQLPAGYKSVFILHDVEGYEHQEVADILGCSIGTSKSQLHKARVKLRKIINRQALFGKVFDWDALFEEFPYAQA